MVIGVHSPEFGYEKEIESVRRFVKDHEISYPNLVDNDHAYWGALENRYWPAMYLVDRKGWIRYVHIGETHRNTDRAREIEREIEDLLAGPD